MTEASPVSTKLYTPQLLSLSAELANYPLIDTYDRIAETRSRTCGSTLELGVSLDSNGQISRLGMQVTACAVGQSSAALMALASKGKSEADLRETLLAIEEWLGSMGPLPNWPGFDALEPALPHKARHGALLLPWKAMQQALSSQAS
ncbi:MAG: iron-sulfur cluster assembly scaffold protein [Pseudomonadota bacterium]